MQLCIFEDSHCLNLEPVAYSRPVYDLVCGINTLKEKILRQYAVKKYSLQCRTYLESLVKLQNPNIPVNNFDDDSYLFINGSVIAGPALAKEFPLKRKDDAVYKNGEKIIAAYVSGKNFERLRPKLYEPIESSIFSGMPEKQVDVKYASYLWDLIALNGKEIINDFEFHRKKLKDKKHISGKIHPGAHILGKKNLIVQKNSLIKPGAVIDASSGPVFIGNDVLIHPNAVIEGPVFIGSNAQIKSGATIYPNVSICNTCKVGGEVENSIFLPYSNKQHSGFIGHAYIGSWVNLGADTNCSDLKNNYGNISAFVNGKTVNSGSQFLGLLMGDHSKTAINTMFNTGTNVGFFSNIFGAGFPDKYIPSFSWGGSEPFATYDTDRAIDVAEKVMARRNKQIQHEEKELIKFIYELTKDERRKRGFPA